MRLILSGGGGPEAVVPIDLLFAEQCDPQKAVLYVPVAMEAHVYTYGECYDWITATYAPYGIRRIDMCTDLRAATLDDRYTAVFIGGGNTYKLLKEVRESGFDRKLTAYLDRGGLLYGGSAGAILCGRTIETAAYLDENTTGLTDFAGLDLLGGKDIFCHYHGSTDEKTYIGRYPRDLYILHEDSGLFIQNHTVTGVGRGFQGKRDLL